MFIVALFPWPNYGIRAGGVAQLVEGMLRNQETLKGLSSNYSSAKKKKKKTH
jgi:hypothetical protein